MRIDDGTPAPGARVAVLAFDAISPFHLSVPCVVFGDRHPGAPTFELRVCAGEPGRLRSTAGFEVLTRHGLGSLRWADTVIVPSWRAPDEPAPEPLLRALVSAHRRGARLVGLCLGAYVLAQAGLLDGRRATTHWSCIDDFVRRFPRVDVETDVLYVDDGDVVTSAGTAAGIDCCLHLLRAGYGAEAANRVARRLVVAPHREGGQAQFVERPVPATPADRRLAGLLEEVRSRLAEPHDLDMLAARVRMTRRTFTRRFRDLVGCSPMQWLLAERVARARTLLETTDDPIERVAERCGFGSAAVLRERFRDLVGVAPATWRRTFAHRRAAVRGGGRPTAPG
jgi:transcriptional regulator GlxA family with amidase domain